MSDFVAAKILTFALRKKFYFSFQHKIMFLSPAKKFAFAPRHKNFCVPPQNLRAKTRKRVCISRRKNAELRAKKNFAPQTAQFARKQKFPKMETLFGSKQSVWHFINILVNATNAHFV